MDYAELEALNLLHEKISSLREHIKTVENERFWTERGDKHEPKIYVNSAAEKVITLRTECSPVVISTFMGIYLSNCKTKLEELESEFNNIKI
jgi:hypothetical protein